MALEGLLPHFDLGFGSPVVLLHGFGLDARMWTAQIAALQSQHRVVAPDLPGFGPLGGDVGPRGPAAEVVRLLEAKALGPIHLVGLSFGGAVAVDLALARPELVRSLVLIDALLLGERTGIRGWASCVERAKQGDLPGAREAWLESEPFERVRSQPEAHERTREMIGAYRCGHWLGTVETVWHHAEPRPLLAGLRCPTLVLVGEMDLPGFRAMARSYAGAIPGARLVELKGLGHLGPMEAPERVNTHLIDFFEEHEV